MAGVERAAPATVRGPAVLLLATLLGRAEPAVEPAAVAEARGPVAAGRTAVAPAVPTGLLTAAVPALPIDGRAAPVADDGEGEEEVAAGRRTVDAPLTGGLEAAAPAVVRAAAAPGRTAETPGRAVAGVVRAPAAVAADTVRVAVAVRGVVPGVVAVPARAGVAVALLVLPAVAPGRTVFAPGVREGVAGTDLVAVVV